MAREKGVPIAECCSNRSHLLTFMVANPFEEDEKVTEVSFFIFEDFTCRMAALEMLAAAGNSRITVEVLPPSRPFSLL